MLQRHVSVARNVFGTSTTPNPVGQMYCAAQLKSKHHHSTGGSCQRLYVPTCGGLGDSSGDASHHKVLQGVKAAQESGTQRISTMSSKTRRRTSSQQQQQPDLYANDVPVLLHLGRGGRCGGRHGAGVLGREADQATVVIKSTPEAPAMQHSEKVSTDMDKPA
eukprot:357218-Chlamydomonas_euryale.AAC.11